MGSESSCVDVIGRQVVQLFHHTNIGKSLANFSCYLWNAESATLAVFLLYEELLMLSRNQKEQHLQLVRNKEKVKIDSDCSERVEKILESGK
jgi:hypothetical protein